MTINAENDDVQVYKDEEGMYRWRRVDAANGRIVSASTEGYVKQSYAHQAAMAYNSLWGVPIEEEE